MLGDQVLDRGQPVVDGVAQEAVAVVDAVLHVRPQRDLEAPGLLEAELPRVDGEVDRSVEHHPADLVGEQVGVRRAELGAVGRAEVEQLRLTERRPQHVHVAGRLDRGDVADQAVGVLHAALVEALVGLLRTAAPPPGVSGSGSAATNASRSASEMQSTGSESPVPRGSKPTMSKSSRSTSRNASDGVLGVRRAGRARAARVDDQRADPGPGIVGRVLEQRQLDRLAAGILVVDGHRQRGALEVAAT